MNLLFPRCQAGVVTNLKHASLKQDYKADIQRLRKNRYVYYVRCIILTHHHGNEDWFELNIFRINTLEGHKLYKSKAFLQWCLLFNYNSKAGYVCGICIFYNKKSACFTMQCLN